jgi:hypothetical protein
MDVTELIDFLKKNLKIDLSVKNERYSSRITITLVLMDGNERIELDQSVEYIDHSTFKSKSDY